MAISIPPHRPYPVFNIAPPSPYSVWASKLQKLGQGPWATPDRKEPMADPAAAVSADSPQEKTIAKENTKTKDGAPKVPHASLGALCPISGKDTGP